MISDVIHRPLEATATAPKSYADAPSTSALSFGTVLESQQMSTEFLAVFGGGGSTRISRPQTSPQSYEAVAEAASSSHGSDDSHSSSSLTGAQIIRALFPGGGTPGPTPSTAAPAPAPTAENVFGPTPWLANPTWIDPDGSVYSYNPQYFATPETTAKVAEMVGGTVVESDACITGPAGPFQQQQPNEMVQLANGTLINPGIVAGFYTHGYSQSQVDQMITNEVGSTLV